jgi:hypothetical protein
VTAVRRAACVLFASSVPFVFARPVWGEGPATDRAAYITVVDGATMEQLLSAAPMGCLAALGGAALLSDRLPLRRIERFLVADPGSLAVPTPGLTFEDAGTLTGPDGTFAGSRLVDLADRIRAGVQEDATVRRVLVVVASADAPPTSRDAGDKL